MGLWLARRGIAILIQLNPESLPHVSEITIDRRVLIFTFFLSLFTGLLSGLIQALQFSRRSLTLTLKNSCSGLIGSWRGFQFRQVLLVFEIALALIVLTGFPPDEP